MPRGKAKGLEKKQPTRWSAPGPGENCTQWLQGLLNSAKDGTTIIIPPGIYPYEKGLALQGVSNVTLIGSGRSSVLRAANPEASAIEIRDCSGIAIRGLVIEGCGTGRLDHADSNGLNLFNVADSAVSDVIVRGVAAAGIFIAEHCRNVSVDGCVVERSLADGIHIVAGTDIRVSNCEGIETGDDSFASIGYKSTGRGSTVFFTSCISVFSRASGVAFEGTDDGAVVNCLVESSRCAGIRVQSSDGWKTLGCDSIRIAANTLRGCRTDETVGHGVIEAAAAYGDLDNILVVDNAIERPGSWPLHKAEYEGYKVDAQWLRNMVDGREVKGP